MKVAICWIGIGDYNILFRDTYNSFHKNFLPETDKTFFIFTDKPELYVNIPNTIVYHIPHACTHKNFILFRKFKYILMAEDKLLDYDYIAYINGNLNCKTVVNIKDIVDVDKPITVTTHPCQIIIKAGQKTCSEQSYAGVKVSEEWKYLQLSFIFSTKQDFLKMANTIEGWRHLDKANGTDVHVRWHDETYGNKYCYLNIDKLNLLDGVEWVCPTDIYDESDSDEFRKCRMYTVHKRRAFSHNNLKFIKATPWDLYKL